jgi:hypothetical protein
MKQHATAKKIYYNMKQKRQRLGYALRLAEQEWTAKMREVDGEQSNMLEDAGVIVATSHRIWTGPDYKLHLDIRSNYSSNGDSSGSDQDSALTDLSGGSDNTKAELHAQCWHEIHALQSELKRARQEHDDFRQNYYSLFEEHVVENSVRPRDELAHEYGPV